MKKLLFSAFTVFVLITTNLTAQDFILTEPFPQLDFESVRTYNDTKIADFRLDPIIREKLMPYYVKTIKELGIMSELHVSSMINSDKTETLLDSTRCDYDKEGRLTSITVNDRVITATSKPSSLFFEYDKKGNLVKIKGDKKTLRTFTRDKTGKITKADNIAYTYKKGALQKVGKMYLEGGYMVEAKKTGETMDRFEGKYDEYGRPWQIVWHEAGVSVAYDTRDRWTLTDGGAEAFLTKVSIDYRDGLMNQLQKTDTNLGDEAMNVVINSIIYRIYRDGK
ncbi:MAG: hypothetical protein IPJ75_05715 [Ignavibacteriales bacterium]|nr:hypothetical protein [Ignavibacteriales bacterium]